MTNSADPRPLAAENAFWQSIDPVTKMDCIKDLLSSKRTALYGELHMVNASPDPCRHQIAYINAQINALDDVWEDMDVADVDRVFLWIFPLAKTANLASSQRT